MDINKVATFLADEAMFKIIKAIDEAKNIRSGAFRNKTSEERELDANVLLEHLAEAEKYIDLIRN